jgi:hypothetical protein
MCVANGIPLGCLLFLPVHTVNSFQTLKAEIPAPLTEHPPQFMWLQHLVSTDGAEFEIIKEQLVLGTFGKLVKVQCSGLNRLFALEDVIWIRHLHASRRVTSGIPLGRPLSYRLTLRTTAQH